MFRKSLCVWALGFTAASPAWAGFVVQSGFGPDPAGIQVVVDQFRLDCSFGGVNNGVGGGPFAEGRREINWDAAGLDAFQSPNNMPPDFFNNNSQRGAVFGPTGTEFLVSQRNEADPADPNLRFGDINPTYNTEFQALSQQRLFSADGTTVTEVLFFVPGEPGTPATVSGFGAILTDVESSLVGASRIQFFDIDGNVLFNQTVPVSGDVGLSFLGATADAGEDIFRVRITTGSTAISSTAQEQAVRGPDLVVMDDLIYSEPQAIPEPATLLLLAAGAWSIIRRKRIG